MSLIPCSFAFVHRHREAFLIRRYSLPAIDNIFSLLEEGNLVPGAAEVEEEDRKQSYPLFRVVGQVVRSNGRWWCIEGVGDKHPAAKRDFVVIMDDEIYSTLNENDWQRTAYVTSPIEEVRKSVNYISFCWVPKFLEKVLWMTICEKEMTKSLFFSFGACGTRWDIQYDVLVGGNSPIHTFTKRRHKHSIHMSCKLHFLPMIF